MSIGKTSKLLLRIVLSLFLLFLLCYTLVQLPPVQTFLVHKITNSLSKSLGAPVKIESVRLKFFKTATLDGVLIGDQSNDTLFYAKEIDANLSLFSFLDKEIYFDEITLSSGQIHLTRAKDEQDFNYQYIVDYFSSGDSSSASPWNIDLRKIRIYDTHVAITDQHSDQDIHLDIGIFSTYLNKLDLNEKVLDIEQIGLGDSYLVAYTEANQDTSTQSTAISFPNSGWSIRIKQIRLDENDLVYQTRGVTTRPYLNTSDLDVKGLSLFVDDFIWAKDILSAQLTQTSFADHSGFSLDQMTGSLEITPEHIYINDFNLTTPKSHLQNTTDLTFKQFDDLRFFADSVKIKTSFQQSEVDLADLKLLIPDFQETPYLNTGINEKLKINGTLSGYINDLQFSKVQLRSNGLLAADMDGKIKNLLHPDQLTYSLTLNQLNTSYRGLKKLTKDLSIPQGIADWNDFKLRGTFKGNQKQITGRNVSLSTSSITRFVGDFDVTGIKDLSKANFKVHFDDLRSVSDDLRGFSNNKLPPALDSLGQFYYAGDFDGTIYNFKLNGKLASDAGSMQTDLSLDFDPGYKDARYSGDLLLDSFDLGKVLAIEELGHLSMSVNIFGNGLKPEQLRATVLGKVNDLVYNDFHYQNLEIDGRFDKRQFAGHASIEDPNISFNFEGVVNVNDSSSRYRFQADVDTINLNALGFISNKLGFSGKIESDFSGSFPDNIRGHVRAHDLLFSNLSEKYKMDSLVLYSDYGSQNHRSLEIRSDILNAKMEGIFNLNSMSKYVRDYINNYFPTDLSTISQDTFLAINPDSITILPKKQDFTFDLELFHADRLLGLAKPEIEKIDTVLFDGEIKSEEKYLQLQGYAHVIKYDGMSFGPITISTTGDRNSLENVFSVRNAHFADGVEFPFITLDMSMADDTAYLGLIMEDASDTIQEKLNIAAMITATDQYNMALNNSMILNGNEWIVNPNHKINFKNGHVNISNLDFRRDSQLLSLATKEIKPGDGIYSAFDFAFEHFQLGEVSQLLDVEDAFYKGNVNGNFSLRSAKDNINYLADLTLSDLTLKGERIGNLVIKSEQRSNELLDILIRLDGGISGLDIRGTYNRSNSALNIQGEIDQLAVKDLDPFLQNYINNSTGKMSGLIKIGGTSKVPVIDGNLEFENVSTFIKYLQARYTFVNEDIAINQNKITLRDFTILDQSKNKAILNGTANFKSITDPDLNLKFKTSRFLILNTPPNSKDLFYGKLYVKADVDVTGVMSHPVLQVNATSLDSTDFVLQPLVSEVNIQQEEFIIFANPNDYKEDTTVSIQDFYKGSGYNFDISANIETTPNAQLTIVIDPTTGDKLVCRGNGNLAIEIAPDGDPKILGSYIISKGQYAFNFQRVLKRTFEIDPGSRVDFVGNVFQSKFDISASYGVKTSTYELIKNQSSLNASEESRSRQRSEVDVKLKLTGVLERPIAKFDIEIKEQSGSGVTSSVSSKLAQLREDESQMNKQVFGLLIFNSFIAEEQNTSASLLADASQSAILSSVSNLLSNELNRLAQRYIKGVDLDFGVDSYSSNISQGSGLITELKVGLSKRLLNDRLTIKLGGNVQFENNDNVELVNNQNSTFSGDFVLEYKLTADGNYNIKFFQVLSNEENIFNPGVNYSETGVSIFFTKSFNSKKYQLQIDE